MLWQPLWEQVFGKVKQIQPLGTMQTIIRKEELVTVVLSLLIESLPVILFIIEDPNMHENI